MRKPKKLNKKIDVHIHFDEHQTKFLREDTEKYRRTLANQIRYIIDSYYAERVSKCTPSTQK